MADSVAGLYVLIQAAGSSSRLGRPKQLIRYQDQSLIRCVSQLALSCGAEQVGIVLGSQFDVMAAELADLPVQTVRNDQWAEGMSTSMKAGLDHLPDSADAVLMLLVDQPLVRREHLLGLIKLWQQNPQSLVACRYAGATGVPAIIPRPYFDELSSVTGDQGARVLFHRHADSVVTMLVEEASLDVDTEEDVLALNKTIKFA